jgi:hypothetical protein
VVVAAKFGNGARELLVIQTKAGSVLPLQHGEVVASAEALNNVGVAPGSSVFDENDMAFEITTVDLDLYFAEDDSTERSAGRHLSRVEPPFEEFRFKHADEMIPRRSTDLGTTRCCCGNAP